MDPRIERLADLLVRYSLRLKPGDLVYLAGDTPAEPLIQAFYRDALRAGAHVDLQAVFPWKDELFYRTAGEEQLSFVSPIMALPIQRYDVRMGIVAPSNTRALSAVDPSRQAMVAAARRSLMQRMLERMEAGEYRWCSFYYPTEALAQEADMSLSDYADFVYGSCFLDDPDPVARWEALSLEQDRLVSWLSAKREIRVVGPDTDLTFSVAGRRWVNCSGRVNMPDGEVFTSPVEDSASGYIRFTYPALAQGRRVEDVRLRLEKGEVVEASAGQNEPFLQEMLRVDEGARRIGEFSFGNNPAITRFTGETAYDEKIGGTIHLAVGASLPETGGLNRSAIHWDLVCDLRRGGEVYVDGELLMKDGSFAIDE